MMEKNGFFFSKWTSGNVLLKKMWHIPDSTWSFYVSMETRKLENNYEKNLIMTETHCNEQYVTLFNLKYAIEMTWNMIFIFLIFESWKFFEQISNLKW